MSVTAGASWSTRQLSSLGWGGDLISCWEKGPLGVPPPRCLAGPKPEGLLAVPGSSDDNPTTFSSPRSSPGTPSATGSPGAHTLPRGGPGRACLCVRSTRGPSRRWARSWTQQPPATWLGSDPQPRRSPQLLLPLPPPSPDPRLREHQVARGGGGPGATPTSRAWRSSRS